MHVHVKVGSGLRASSLPPMQIADVSALTRRVVDPRTSTRRTLHRHLHNSTLAQLAMASLGLNRTRTRSSTLVVVDIPPSPGYSATGAGTGTGTQQLLFPRFTHRLHATFTGVTLPTLEFQWSILLFVRFASVLASSGLLPTVAILLVCALTVAMTVSSVSAIATNGMPRGGVHAVLDRSLGVGIGGGITLIYYAGLAVLVAVELHGSGRQSVCA